MSSTERPPNVRQETETKNLYKTMNQIVINAAQYFLETPNFWASPNRYWGIETRTNVLDLHQRITDRTGTGLLDSWHGGIMGVGNKKRITPNK